VTSGFVWRFVYRLACAVLIGWAYRLGRRALGVLGAAARSDGALMAQVLVLRQQNAVLRRQIARVRYQPADRAWFAALSGLIPRARWGEVFAVTPATLLCWHRRLVAGKHTAARQRAGRPSTRPAVKALIVRRARDNASWGHERIDLGRECWLRVDTGSGSTWRSSRGFADTSFGPTAPALSYALSTCAGCSMPGPG